MNIVTLSAQKPVLETHPPIRKPMIKPDVPIHLFFGVTGAAGEGRIKHIGI